MFATALLAAGLSLSALAGRGPPDAETRYLEARLVESAEGDLEKAIGIYAELARELEGKEQAAIRARVLEALGEAHRTLGQLDKARQAFDACRRISTSGLATVDTSGCAARARLVALEEGSVQRLPLSWSFEDANHGFVLFSELGSMAVEDTGADRCLVWTEDVDGPRLADLIVAMSPSLGPIEGIRLEARTEGLRAILFIVVEDTSGRTYGQRAFFEAVDRPRIWDIDVSDLEPLDPTWPDLDPASIARIRIRDGTGTRLPDERSRHRIIIDDFRIW